MANIGEEAENYESPKTQNIADLKTVDIDTELFEKVGTDNNGKSFSYKYIKVDDQEYRVPAIVLKQLKEIKKEKPGLKSFKVKKSGEGLNTTYVVIGN